MENRDPDVILPAGGRIRGAFAAEAGTEIKALISLHGQTVLQHTLQQLRATNRVGRVVVVGPRPVHAAGNADAVLPEGGSGPDNIFRGLEWLRKANGGEHVKRVLIVATDLPFLTPASLTGFLDACPPDTDICLPAVRREAFQARFPGSANQYVTLRDGAWTMGCAFLVSPEALARSRVHIDRVFAARKSQLAMARLLGPSFITRFLLRRLQVTDIERRCSDILGCTGAAVTGCAPELAFDIDLPQDYQYAVAGSAGEPLNRREP